MKKLKLYFEIVLVSLPMASHVTNVFASELPHFKKHESYMSVRTKMMQAGWKPYHANGADTCVLGDTRCQGRPEMEACAGSGKANCRFLWAKEGKTAAICTVGEDAVFDNVCKAP